MDMRKTIQWAAFAVAGLFIITTIASMNPVAGISQAYNMFGPKIAPNMVTAILFDFRGYDTLGECFILVSGVLALSIVYGRGRFAGDVHEEEQPTIGTTSLLKSSAAVMLPLIIIVGLYITLGGHITPGGGFQGGSIIAAGLFMAVVLYGVKSINLTHSLLVKMESFGLLIYILFGLAGYVFGGYFLYNLGTDVFGIMPDAITQTFNYPDGVGAGIIPYLNIAVLLKVAAGLATALLIILGGKK